MCVLPMVEGQVLACMLTRVMSMQQKHSSCTV